MKWRLRHPVLTCRKNKILHIGWYRQKSKQKIFDNDDFDADWSWVQILLVRLEEETRYASTNCTNAFSAKSK